MITTFPAYGTYKLAKKMTSGIRQAYDNDDCWEYNLFRGHYECKCQNNQCYEYANSAAAFGSAILLLVASTVFSFVQYRRTLCLN